MHGRSQRVEKGGPSAPELGELVKCAQRKRQQFSNGAYLEGFLNDLEKGNI
jgi:hypothetical protein